jgi:hypothetical protein
MANNSAFKFSSPATYSDWANYAGFDRTTGEIGGSQAAVPPPQTMDQRLESAQGKLSAIAPAMQQLGQGNITQAVGMMRGQSSPQGAAVPGAPMAPAATPVPVNNDYDYMHDFENSGLSLPALSMPAFG